MVDDARRRYRRDDVAGAIVAVDVVSSGNCETAGHGTPVPARDRRERFLRAGLAAPGPARRADRRRDGRAPGHGVRGARRVGAVRGLPGDPRGVADLRDPGHQPAPGRRSRTRYRSARRTCSGTTRRRRPRPLPRAHGRARGHRRCARAPRRAAPPGIRGEPAVQAGAGRLHHRRRPHAALQPARVLHGCGYRRRLFLPAFRRVLHPPRSDRRTHDRRRLGDAGDHLGAAPVPACAARRVDRARRHDHRGGAGRPRRGPRRPDRSCAADARGARRLAR